MIKPEHIPDAAAFALDDCRKDPDASPWDLIAAAINAWPGMWQKGDAGTFHGAVPYPAIILPLPQENTND